MNTINISNCTVNFINDSKAPNQENSVDTTTNKEIESLKDNLLVANTEVKEYKEKLIKANISLDNAEERIADLNSVILDLKKEQTETAKKTTPHITMSRVIETIMDLADEFEINENLTDSICRVLGEYEKIENIANKTIYSKEDEERNSKEVDKILKELSVTYCAFETSQDESIDLEECRKGREILVSKIEELESLNKELSAIRDNLLEEKEETEIELVNPFELKDIEIEKPIIKQEEPKEEEDNINPIEEKKSPIELSIIAYRETYNNYKGKNTARVKNIRKLLKFSNSQIIEKLEDVGMLKPLGAKFPTTKQLEEIIGAGENMPLIVQEDTPIIECKEKEETEIEEPTMSQREFFDRVTEHILGSVQYSKETFKDSLMGTLKQRFDNVEEYLTPTNDHAEQKEQVLAYKKALFGEEVKEEIAKNWKDEEISETYNKFMARDMALVPTDFNSLIVLPLMKRVGRTPLIETVKEMSLNNAFISDHNKQKEFINLYFSKCQERITEDKIPF